MIHRRDCPGNRKAALANSLGGLFLSRARRSPGLPLGPGVEVLAHLVHDHKDPACGQQGAVFGKG